MPVIDIIIVIAIIISVIIGLLRGFVKEAISIAALLFAIWAALYLGPALGKAMAGWLDSEEMQMWFGRIFLFAVIVSLGALVSWGLSKLVRLSLLAGMDRFLGSVFGLARAVLLVGLLWAWLAYKGAVAQAWGYGQQIRAAVDLYRFDLLKALHQSLPVTPQEERAMWGRLAAWLYNQDRGVTAGLAFDHGTGNVSASPPEESQDPAEATGLWGFVKRFRPDT